MINMIVGFLSAALALMVAFLLINLGKSEPAVWISFVSGAAVCNTLYMTVKYFSGE